MTCGHLAPSTASARASRTLRKERGLSLLETRKKRSACRNRRSLASRRNRQLVSAHHLYQMSKTLGVDISAFFDAGSKPMASGIRSIQRRGEGIALVTARYEALVLGTDIANKRCIRQSTRSPSRHSKKPAAFRVMKVRNSSMCWQVSSVS